MKKRDRDESAARRARRELRSEAWRQRFLEEFRVFNLEPVGRYILAIVDEVRGTGEVEVGPAGEREAAEQLRWFLASTVRGSEALDRGYTEDDLEIMRSTLGTEGLHLEIVVGFLSVAPFMVRAMETHAAAFLSDRLRTRVLQLTATAREAMPPELLASAGPPPADAPTV